ncbi:MAG TPA: hypothetical protein VJT13_19170 [Xanthobacteraceae bacterium]|nr:hypothetical protein [Xanthobacteraceae bacterium]
MTDIHDMRAQMREGRGSRPVVVEGGGGFKIPFGLLAGGAVIAGFLVVVFTPKIYSVQRTAALPAFKEARQEPAASAAAAPTATVPAVAPVTSAYAGKSPDEVGKIADAVCEQLLVNAPQRGQAAVEAKLQCFLSQGTARFCNGSQARKATADIINYFKGIEYTNKAMAMAASIPFRSSSGDALPSTPLTPDPRVADAIEGLMRAGYLNRGHREDIAANVPRAYKERFARVVGIKPSCPVPPWWAVWK